MANIEKFNNNFDDIKNKDNVDRLVIVNQLGKEFISSLDFETVVKRVLTRVKDILNCEASSLLLFDESSNHLKFFGVSGKGEEVLKGLHVPYGKGIAWWSFINGEDIIVDDVLKDGRFYSDVDKVTGLRTKNVICVPIIKDDKKLGVIEGINNISGKFNKNDLSLLKTISQFIALSIENSIVHRRLEEKNIELKSANQDLHEFIKVISHDLQTPLSSIKGYIDLLKEELESNKLNRPVIDNFLNRIQKNIVDIMNFIRDLLDFIEMKPKDLVISSFDPLSALKEIISVGEKEYKAQPILLEIEGVIKNIRFDRNLFFRLIKLIIQNYFKIYRELKSIKIKLGAADDGYILFKIIPLPYNHQTENVWLRNMIYVELSYLGKIFSILGGKILADSFLENSSIEFMVPILK